MDPDDDPALVETQSPALAVRPVPDARTRDVARAKVANALFANHEPVKLGRYHLIERVGQGGMGVVWGAFDPELERRVAIKLVRTKTEASRERILLEGQALAKLSHPNVVAVHDVGVVDDEVFL
ncbi:MAG TPA: protein kinase, partial [Kofleriaceae bacterium]